ncbi:MAG TPA: SpoIIE family protein phosphatase [Bacteroidia bacterium]|nr:SpoIIE family protein phosphatase [Bacteroidia bacterium]
MFSTIICHFAFAQSLRDSIIKILQEVNYNNSNFNKTYPLTKKALNLSLSLKDTGLIIKCYQKIGDVLWYKSAYGEAEEYYFKSLELADSARYPGEYAYALYGIGWIECIQKGKKDKISLLNKAISVYIQLSDTAHFITLSSAVSGAYKEFYHQDTSKKFYIDSAINTLLFAINILEKSTLKKNLPKIEINLAQELYEKGDNEKAYLYINRALSNPILSKNERNFIYAILIKSSILNKLPSRIYKDSSRYFLKKYFETIQSYQDNEVLSDFYDLLYQHNKEDKNYAKALFYLEKYLQTIKKSYQELLSVKYEELEANKELFQKEQSLIALQKQNELNELRNKQTTTILIIVTAFGLIVAFFLIKTLKQNSRIKKLNTEIIIQKNLLEQKNKDITDSINYASRIQNALITSEEFIQKHFINENLFADYFVLYLPKDIVSGDFYWANINLQHPDYPHYFAVCDCTGHGVPGAFMSLLNINYLNEAVQERKLYYPDEILNYVRKKLIENLTYDEQQKDGMDASLLMFNKEFLVSQKVYYSLANHQMTLIRGEEPPVILTGDKMPVGKGHFEESFQLKVLEMQKGDWLYLYTDGYKDQFGGLKNKRIMQKRFNEILSEIRRLRGIEQREELLKFFVEWKKTTTQTDDVCVIGIKI